MGHRSRARVSGKAWLAALALLLPAVAAADPAAWRMTGANGAEVTLLGSMHVLRPSDHPLPVSVDALIDRAEIIVREIDMDDVDAAAQQRLILETAMLPQGTVLANVIDEKVYEQLEQNAAQLGVDLKLLERFEPWFLSVTLLDQGLRKFGFQAERGVEQYVLGRARRTNKQIVGLETLEFQLNIFDSLSRQSQQAMLEQTLAEIDEAEPALRAMADAWRDGELETLSVELLDDFDGFPGLYETLVADRNRTWVPALERMLTEGRRYLVVVGALHLVGDGSVIELLQARGHHVERLH
ncbi:MAG TPA: TraB/GumN family protein [Gammaproteobacteria bacterium]|nr:TraB/GumN family protein [Gammaproteobacteria bacterium]